jgi:hypothetical protein
MRGIFVAIFLQFLLVCSHVYAQPREGIELTAGIEFKALLNPGVFNLDSVVLIDDGNNFRAVHEYAGGFGFGGIVRIKLTKIWNIETGLNYTRRRFDMRITDLQAPFDGATSLRVIGYEIPLKGLVYIQMGKQVFMNVALGGSLDFFASDVIAIEQIYRFKGFKNSWARGAVTGSVGLEFRTDKDGYFYLGGTYHQMIGDMMVSEVTYFRDGQNPVYGQRGVLDGTYFSVDFRYFFPMQKPNKPKVNYVKPDWKNM